MIHPWYVLEPFEQRAKALLHRLLIAPALDQNVEDVVVLVDSAPQVMALPVDRHKDLVQIPLVTWPGASALQLMGILLPTLPTPLAYGLVGHVDAALA